jgi:hypothetical protein
MKRIFTLIIAVIACASQMFAQLSILNDQNEPITGSTINVPANANTEIIFKVKNVGTSSLSNLKAHLFANGTEATNENEAEFSFCINGSCGVNGACPKFSLEPDEDMEIHFSIKPLTATDFVVKAYPTDDGTPEATFNVHVNTSGISSVSANSFNVYPSPANESFTIENGFGKNSYVEIYNVLGQSVKHIQSDNTNNISVNCSDWKNGYYVCRLYKDGKAEKTVKIVVAH